MQIAISWSNLERLRKIAKCKFSTNEMGNTITVKVSEYSKTKYMAFLPEQLIEQLNVAIINDAKLLLMLKKVLSTDLLKIQKHMNLKINELRAVQS
ncbi:hypothetical protein [Mucilaginibacter robiniae]|uniref:hypothetical protein n=1 Tax=Mucilaginibacter robiniae TaxID=2728022 RepID=UPI001B7D1942|nr:hypothetical protein [Mucilaginibacter robiniae]